MKQSLYSNIPDEIPEELFTTLVQSESVKIERIVSDGHTSPEGYWYDQESDEWVLLLSGAAVLEVECGSEVQQVELVPGDCMHLPARQRHRVCSTSQTEKTVWLAIHF